MKTLADLGERFRLYAVCDSCGRMEVVDVAALLAAGGDQAIADVTRRLRCNRCHGRASGIRIVYAAAGGYRRPLLEAPRRD